MKTKTTITIALILTIVIVSFAYFFYKSKVSVESTEPVANDKVETPTYIPEIMEGADPKKDLPPAEIIPLTEICLQVPAETEDSVKILAMVAVERWLKNQKQTDVKTVEKQVESNLKAIKDTNNIE
jgi:hypothetical protein